MRQRGFTLIELIVSITIIGVLLALVAPAITKVRETARLQRDVSTIRGVARASLVWATDHNDFWPHLVDAPRRLYDVFTCDYSVNYEDWFAQSTFWTIPLHGYIEPSAMVSAFDPLNTGYLGFDLTPEQIAGFQEYNNSGCAPGGFYMSSSLITNWALWKSDEPIVDESQLRPVRTAEVAHPSNKAMFTQTFPYYLPGFNLDQYQSASLADGFTGFTFDVPVALCDGSASAINLTDFPAHIINPFFGEPPEPLPSVHFSPLSNTRDGFLGRDFN